MKRKRGNKKGKSKKTPAGDSEAVSNDIKHSAEENSGLDDCEQDEPNSDMETEEPSSIPTDEEVKAASTSEVIKTKPPERLVYGRVKVKIKTPKILETQLASSDICKSGQQVVLEKRVVPEETKVSVNVPANLSKKSGSIKIKSAKGLSSSSLSPCNNIEKEVSMEKSVDEKKRAADSVKDSSPISDTKQAVQVKELSCRVPQQNKKELNTALEVIKKIMKMEAADPFNAPVNPIALCIPDYLDVIDTPMDFGTICSNIENGVKYMNAEDVLKDVKFIWANCYKYNNKGDYILELMKRVKKNFSKYWSAAGFSNELTQDNGGDNNQLKDLSSGKKGGNSKHNSKKRQNRVKRHKDDCMCAICVMMRRRQERESTQTDEELKDTTDSPSGREVKSEDNSPVESGGGGEGTSSSVDNSVDQDQDAVVADKADEVQKEDKEQQQQQQQMISPVEETQAEGCTDNEVIMKEADEVSEHSERSEEHDNDQSATVENQNETQLGEMLMQEQHTSESAATEYQNPKEPPLDKMEKSIMFEKLRCLENPMFLELCGTLFSDNPKSIWTGPHSLIHRQGPAQSSSIHAAVSTFLK